MKLTPELKAKIDAMDYSALLARWRFSPSGDQLFQDESGKYFSEQIAKMRDKIGAAAHARISKEIGW